jgi:hypothetical protein
MRQMLTAKRDRWDLALAICCVISLQFVGVAGGHDAAGLLGYAYFYVFVEPVTLLVLIPLFGINWLLISSSRSTKYAPRTKRIVFAHLLGTAVCIAAFFLTDKNYRELPIYSSIPWLAFTMIRSTRLLFLWLLRKRSELDANKRMADAKAEVFKLPQ